MATEREYLEARERREWIAAEQEREREIEDRAEYEKYLQMERQANAAVAPANRVQPVSFEQFRAAMPQDQSDPRLRGSIAANVVTLRRLGRIAVDRVNGTELTDQELSMLGFDVSDRVVAPEALSVVGIADAFKHFAKSEPRYVFSLHYGPITDFLSRNKLFPSDNHIRLTFNHLFDLHLFGEPEPQIEPEPTPKVNLQIAPDLELEARKRREKYETEIVVTDPETGKGWTEYQLDHHADSETFRRLMRIPRVVRTGLEPRH